ncbi:DUF934 domain-containing protein [Roseospira marina]|uniref:DUF934 domain-containing protein n=1 Tax=Roseospira marina TaxID=140057 RepID=A0A5M6II66_9PROT|nr:DUF934 domain-containing protein [Roseospira marina]KAA5607365.1 DUF934 domain-containing protein [Roseospira marina]MBB4312467.1 uncharacterized protein (DUF934 family) [Roseospira marina]MBB5085517.1 uncharacterized protein (DUF934 family) [Roseospira marina]
MPLLENGHHVADRWTALPDAEPVPDDGPVLVSLDRLKAEADTLWTRSAPIGVRLPNDVPVSALVAAVGGALDRLSLIVLSFPAFKDGRAYTQARQLRDTHGYQGSLRATGDVLRDQLYFMARCGIDAVEIDSTDPEGDWQASVTTFGAVYQPASDDRTPISVQRLAALGRKGVAA